MTAPRLKVVTVVGTRPELIRLSRTIARLDETFDHRLVHTGQSYDYELNQIFFDELRIRAPDHYLAVDTSSLGHVLGGTLIGIEPVLEEIRPDALLVLGDTNSCIAALMAKRMHIPVYHMEAGNRSFDANVPEEINRRLIDHIADFNLVYTEHARRNLLAEGLPSQRISLTGSPMAEVLYHYRDGVDTSNVLSSLGIAPRQYFLVSTHREENVDNPIRLRELVVTISAVHSRYGLPIFVSTHPRTLKRLTALGLEAPEGVRFERPFGFLDYIRLQRDAFCVLSDSGTISEESAILGFPAVTIRDAIERPEALETGSIISAGIRSEVVLPAIDQVVHQRTAGAIPPTPTDYQVHNFSQRVVNFIRSTVHVHHQWAGIRRNPAYESTAASDLL